MPPGEGRDAGPRSVSASGGGQMLEQIQAQLSGTAQALNLNPRQQALWETYQSRVGALVADQMRVDFNSAMRRTAMQQIHAKVDTVRNRLTALEDIATAAQALYQSLDETQRAVADQRLAGTVPALYSGLGSPGGAGPMPGGRNGGAGMGGPGGMGTPPGRGGPGGGF